MKDFCLGFVLAVLSIALVGCGGDSTPATIDQQAVDPGTEAEKMKATFGIPDAQGNMPQPAAPGGATP